MLVRLAEMSTPANPPSTDGSSDQGVLDLSQAIHDSVMQRLAAASMALAEVEDLAPGDRRRAAQEVTGALGALRELLEAATRGLDLERIGAPVEQEPEVLDVVLSVMAEALANIHKHASPGRIWIHMSHDHQGVDLEVLNDGPTVDSTSNGLGLRLAELQLRSIGGELECGPAADDRWRVRMRVPAWT
jgi:signal transduction histidine kinase